MDVQILQQEKAIYDKTELQAICSRKSLYRFFKRIGDITLSTAALVVLSPIFLLVALMIKLEDGGNTIYVQERNGINGKVFRMYKFRSMCMNAEEIHKDLLEQNELDGPAFKMKNDPRITKIGKFIRKTSIDELPQLINIIKGDMSIVGPRPLPTYETAQCNEYQNQRLLVKPGLTCYWQCCGKNNISFDEWIEMDLRYIREAGIRTDLKIIRMAVKMVIEAGRVPVYCLVKRIADIVFSLIGLIVLSPVFLVTAVSIVIEDGGPVFYTQKRIGKGCREFKIYKFRSMYKNAEQIHEQMKEEYKCQEVSFKLRDDPRITKVGNVIRKFNIDELPQLFNILKGDMGIVGPRPLPLYEYVSERRIYGDKYIDRYSIPQGLTCIWQISDRASVDFGRRMEMDVEYAHTKSLWLDFKLIIKTIIYTITGKAGY